ncbi:hypothetical protein DSECCO2_441850 [anaerobic digester metagenome]
MAINPAKRITRIIKNGEPEHIWQFSRVGGVNRVNIVSGEDIALLDTLDQKLWTALSCPVSGLEIDDRTLDLIDSDDDGRIRVPEIILAGKWITTVIKNPDELLEDRTKLPLDSIDDSTDEGKELLASALQILKNLGKEGQTDISVEETSDVKGIFADTKFNGDGIITADSTDDESLKSLIENIITCLGSKEDRNGNPGVDTELIDTFFQHCEDYNTWQMVAKTNQTVILPFGVNTASALNAFNAVKEKVDDYFLRCRLAEYDPASAEVLNAQLAQYEAISPKNLAQSLAEISALPVAKMNGTRNLPLVEGVNPAWGEAMAVFNEQVVKPVFGQKKELTHVEWQSLPQKFASYQQWLTDKKGAEVEQLGAENITAILEKNHKESLVALVAEDMKLETEANNIIKVDRLVRYYRDLHTLLRNYVNFSDFYQPGIKGIFQAGELYIDQRCCDLCIKVTDMPKHTSMAGGSGICLLYCDCVSRKRGEKMTIVAALTDGDNDDITVGRNAIFYDRKGQDWDATIVNIIDNPISIRQAFWSPYKKLSKFISKQVEKMAASKEKEVETHTTGKVEATATKVDTGINTTIKGETSPPPAPAAPAPGSPTPAAGPAPAFDIGKFAGIFAALSIALSAIGSILLAILTGFLSLTWWQMPLALIGLMLTISLPSMILAFLKLRKRNLAHVLDANGWAINARLTINIIFGRTLTHLASLPENSKLNLIDPFKKKRNPWIPVIVILCVLAAAALVFFWHYGYLEEWGVPQFFQNLGKKNR